MRKSKLSKWINPTGKEYWDDYYIIMAPALYINLIMIIALIAVASYNTFFK